ncbi:MAG: site-specific DNA-methyltransferase [Anaerolineales bacterium]|nr:site-specific DNA-methyltransferase [Anaerolineales bacterium]MCX7607739.1 site-specific DNA-methyltransferase [Anaerolineales bacterium]MDW8226312.1 DNA methyltransferase [Anaerolineales bacterium]
MKQDDTLFMMNYSKQNEHLRVRFPDEACHDVFEGVWIDNMTIGHSPRRFIAAHPTILHSTKSKQNRFYKDQVAVPHQNPTNQRIKRNLANGSKGRMPYDWFYFGLVKNVSREKTVHACQFPQVLVEMLIKACMLENDIVLVLFGGSRSEIEVRQRLNHRFISAEIDPKYHRIIEDRLREGRIVTEHRLLYRLRREAFSSTLSQPQLFNNAGQYTIRFRQRVDHATWQSSTQTA